MGLFALLEPITRGGKLPKADNFIVSLGFFYTSFRFDYYILYYCWLILIASSIYFSYRVFCYKAKDIAIAFSIYNR